MSSGTRNAGLGCSLTMRNATIDRSVPQPSRSLTSRTLVAGGSSSRTRSASRQLNAPGDPSGNSDSPARRFDRENPSSRRVGAHSLLASFSFQLVAHHTMTPIDPLGQNIGMERAFFVGRRGINLPPCPVLRLDDYRCLGGCLRLRVALRRWPARRFSGPNLANRMRSSKSWLCHWLSRVIASAAVNCSRVAGWVRLADRVSRMEASS